MTVTPIRSRQRGTSRAGNQPVPAIPGTAEWLEAQAAKWPEHAAELLAEAEQLRAQKAA